MIDKRKPTIGEKTVQVQIEVSERELTKLFGDGRHFNTVLFTDGKFPNARTYIRGSIIGFRPPTKTVEKKTDGVE